MVTVNSLLFMIVNLIKHYTPVVTSKYYSMVTVTLFRFMFNQVYVIVYDCWRVGFGMLEGRVLQFLSAKNVNSVKIINNAKTFLSKESTLLKLTEILTAPPVHFVSGSIENGKWEYLHHSTHFFLV